MSMTWHQNMTGKLGMIHEYHNTKIIQYTGVQQQFGELEVKTAIGGLPILQK